MNRKTSLVEFLRNSPLAEVELNLERIQDEPRDDILYDFITDEGNSAINSSNTCKSIFKPRPI